MYISGVKATAEKEASCISICHKAVESTHQPCSGDNKLPCLLLSPILIVHISLWTLSLSTTHKQINTLLLNPHEHSSLLSSISLTYGSWGECCLVGDLTPRIHGASQHGGWFRTRLHSPQLNSSPFSESPRTTMIFCQGRLNSLPSTNRSHGLNTPTCTTTIPQ